MKMAMTPESDAPFLIQFQPGTGSAYGTGKGRGKGDKKKGIMSKVNPKIKEGKPKHNFSSMIGAARTAKGRAAEAKYNSSRHLVKKGDNLTKIANSLSTSIFESLESCLNMAFLFSETSSILKLVFVNQHLH